MEPKLCGSSCKAAAAHDYDPHSVVTAELADSIPEGIDTVFWEQVMFLSVSGYPLCASPVTTECGS
jgi:hypothetical protein